MKFENFKGIIDQMIENSTKLSAVYSSGIDLVDFVDGYMKANRLLWKELLTDSGLEWLEWFLYEKGYIDDEKGDPELSAYARTFDPITKEPIDTEIMQDLNKVYEYFIDNNYFRCEQCAIQK